MVQTASHSEHRTLILCAALAGACGGSGEEGLDLDEAGGAMAVSGTGATSGGSSPVSTPAGGNRSAGGGSSTSLGMSSGAGGEGDSSRAGSMNSGAGATGGTTTVGACGSDVSVNHTPFGCEFAWGANGDQGNRSNYLDFITTWVGYEWSQGREGDCDGCGLAGDLENSDAVAVYYAYFAGYALPDCNQQPNNNLCTDGARWIKQNRSRYIGLYEEYARRTYAVTPSKGVVWLLEGDFVQYTYEEQNDPFTMQELGDLAREVVCAIKSNEPNAIVAMNHSGWISNELTDEFWNAMPLDIMDMVWTTGVGNNDGFIEAAGEPGYYNAQTATYAYLHELTGKPIWVDTSFGISQMDDSWTGIGADELNARIAEGVIAANVTEPPNDYQSRISRLSGQLDGVCE